MSNMSGRGRKRQRTDPSAEAMETMSCAIKQLQERRAERKRHDEYDSFGNTVAGLIRDLPAANRTPAMIKVLEAVNSFKQDSAPPLPSHAAQFSHTPTVQSDATLQQIHSPYGIPPSHVTPPAQPSALAQQTAPSPSPAAHTSAFQAVPSYAPTPTTRLHKDTLDRPYYHTLQNASGRRYTVPDMS